MKNANDREWFLNELAKLGYTFNKGVKVFVSKITNLNNGNAWLQAKAGEGKNVHLTLDGRFRMKPDVHITGNTPPRPTVYSPDREDKRKVGLGSLVFFVHPDGQENTGPQKNHTNFWLTLDDFKDFQKRMEEEPIMRLRSRRVVESPELGEEKPKTETFEWVNHFIGFKQAFVTLFSQPSNKSKFRGDTVHNEGGVQQICFQVWNSQTSRWNKTADPRKPLPEDYAGDVVVHSTPDLGETNFGHALKDSGIDSLAWFPSEGEVPPKQKGDKKPSAKKTNKQASKPTRKSKTVSPQRREKAPKLT